jgi:hypothetical protein
MIDPQTSFTLSYSGSQGRKGTNYTNINLPAYKTTWSSEYDEFDDSRPNNAGRFGDIYVQRGNLNSFYNAGIVSFQHRFSHGYQFLSNYTWGKTISDYPYVNNLSYNGAPGGGSSGFQYPNLNNRGETNGSHRQRFVMSGIWSPSYGKKWPVMAKIALTGWQISGTETLESGDRLSITNSLSTANDYAGMDQPNVTGNPNIGHGSKTFANQFNAGAFSDPGFGVRGNAGLGTVQGPGRNNVDLSLAKNFKIWDSLSANLRADAYNAFNHSQWTSVETDLHQGGIPLGTVTGSREARIAQISVKVSF